MVVTRKLALCVGINDYPGTESDLAGCVNDALAWSETLGRRGFTTTTLLDGEATRAALLDETRHLVAELGRGDVGVITFSGHGTWVPDADGDETDARDEALCPHDVATAGPVGDDELFELLSARTYGARLVLLADSCHSGTVSRLAAPVGRGAAVRFMPPEVALPTEADAGLTQLFPRSAVPVRRVRTTGLLLAGCADHEYAYDGYGDVHMGAFTHVALAALRELRGDATYRDWMRAIRTRLPAVNLPQTPQAYGTRAQLAWPVLA